MGLWDDARRALSRRWQRVVVSSICHALNTIAERLGQSTVVVWWRETKAVIGAGSAFDVRFSGEISGACLCAAALTPAAFDGQARSAIRV